MTPDPAVVVSATAAANTVGAMPAHDDGAPVPTEAETEAAARSQSPFTRPVTALSHLLTPERLGTGALAELRRMDPGGPVLPPAFWRLRFQHLPEALCRDAPEPERAWAVILHGMAQFPPPCHRPGRENHIGAALQETGYSEARFIRLLRAEGPGLAHECRIACRWLAVKGRAIDWEQCARFLYYRITDPAGAWAERLSQDLARDYFAAESRSDNDNSS